MLRFRKNELTTTWTGDKKRGSLNTPKLYKHRTGNNRIFKQKHEIKDTIRSFTFTLLVDVSSSMNIEDINKILYGIRHTPNEFKPLQYI